MGREIYTMDYPKVGTYRAYILVVDHDLANLHQLVGMLKECNYQTRTALNGKMALQIAQIESPDLILLNPNIHEPDGIEIFERLKTDRALKDIPVILLAGHDGNLDRGKFFRAGGADYLPQPFQSDEVAARIENQLKIRRLQLELEEQDLRLLKLIQPQIKEVADLQMAMIFALAKMADARENPGRHLERVQIYSRALALKLREKSPYLSLIEADFIEHIYHASPLHDIGKVSIPDAVLLKAGQLTAKEFKVMTGHTLLGAQALQAIHEQYPRNAFINMGIEIARSHHERWDGQGYPDGLKGEAIPLSARILAVADIYDILRSKRCYKQALSHENSCQTIQVESGKAFDPDVVGAFTELELEFWDVRNRLED
jgi:putative two-component system response regulator